MGFLHKLWDETLAGPTPDSGLGKLRKYNSLLAPRSNRPPPLVIDDNVLVSRSITILRSNSVSASSCSGSGSAPSSPCSSAAPTPPFSPTTPGGNFKKLTRRKSTAESMHHRTDPKSPTGYDWSCLSCQVIAKPELGGLRLALPTAIRNFPDGYKPKLQWRWILSQPKLGKGYRV